MITCTTHQQKRSKEGPPVVRVRSSRIPSEALDRLTGLEQIQEQIGILNKAPAQASEEAFHKLERDFIKSNEAVILRCAKPVSEHLAALMLEARQNWDSLHHFRFAPEHSKSDAIAYRCIYVPLAYRLGYYTLAAKLAQMTFERLLPNLEKRVRDAVRSLTEHSEAEAHSLVHERFTSNAPVEASCYSRPKTPHSTWKKVGSVIALEKSSSSQFADKVDDYLMVVWGIPLQKGEPRINALEKAGHSYYADPELRKIKRKHTCHIEEGFPVTMVHSIWRGIPVEVQFFGGKILGWLAAMDYGKYKIGTWLDHIDERLSPEEWKARGDTMLRIYEESSSRAYEEGDRPEFHRVLLDEVLGNKPQYDKEASAN